MKRIVNTIGSHIFALTPEEALKLLRKRHLDEDGIEPIAEAKAVLYAAFPQAVRVDESGARRVNYRLLLDLVLLEFVPAFQAGGAPGRPATKKDGLVEAVDGLIATGEARSITHACNMIEHRRQFPEITDVRKAYYRRKKLSQ